jgi:hypothetical protein
MVRHSEETRRELSAAVRTGNIRAWKSHCIERLVRSVEARRQKSLLGVLAENRVAPERIMHRNVHNVSRLKSQPAHRARKVALFVRAFGVGIWPCIRHLVFTNQWDALFGSGNNEIRIASRTVGLCPGSSFIGHELLPARRT